MKKIETSIEKLKEDIRNFYDCDKHHFIVMNAVELAGQMEVQWLFNHYDNPEEIICFYHIMDPSMHVPGIRDIVHSAWVAEAELVDLMNIEIEKTEKGFVLEPDSESGPLLKKK